jgi:sugar-phosphatase
MDGVLVDSRGVVERTWRSWAARHGIDADPLLRVAHGRRTSDTLREVVPHLATSEEVAWLDAAELADSVRLVAVPGAARLLATLSGIPWAVVTSAGRELARRRLAGAGLPLPPVLVSSDDVARGKPAPDGYLLAAERLLVAAGQAIVLEDALAGVAAARAAGSTVIGIATTHTPAQLAGAAFVVPDLTPVTIERTATRWRVLVHPFSARLALLLQSREETRAMIDALSPSEKEELSADWLARIDASDTADPWTDPYAMVLRQSGVAVGQCGFKGPPDEDGVVEIAYGVGAEHQGNGYATETAQALTGHAFASGEVAVVRAHTRPEPNASTRVLTRCGYRYVGEVTDPEDGLVWRWERKIEKADAL